MEVDETDLGMFERAFDVCFLTHGRKRFTNRKKAPG